MSDLTFKPGTSTPQPVSDAKWGVKGTYQCGCELKQSDKIKAFCPTHKKPFDAATDKALGVMPPGMPKSIEESVSAAAGGEASELSRFVDMLERAEIGNGMRQDFNPASTGVQVELLDGTILDWLFDAKGQLTDVIRCESESDPSPQPSATEPQTPDRRDAKGEEFACPQCGYKTHYRITNEIISCSRPGCHWMGLPKSCGLAPPALAAPEQEKPGKFMAIYGSWRGRTINAQPSPSPADRDTLLMEAVYEAKLDAAEACLEIVRQAVERRDDHPNSKTNAFRQIRVNVKKYFDGHTPQILAKLNHVQKQLAESSDAMGRLNQMMDTADELIKICQSPLNSHERVGSLTHWQPFVKLRSALANARKGGV